MDNDDYNFRGQSMSDSPFQINARVALKRVIQY